MKTLLALMLCAAVGLPAAAQTSLPALAAAPGLPSTDAPELLPDSSTTPTSTPVLVTPAPNVPAPTALPTVTPYKVSARLSVPTNVSPTFTLTLIVQNGQSAALTFTAARDNRQNCASAPSVRVLKVGSREVVYPNSDKRVCTQELISRAALGGSLTTFSRTLTLPAGEYMVESWFQGQVGPVGSGVPLKIDAAPVRIVVK